MDKNPSLSPKEVNDLFEKSCNTAKGIYIRQDAKYGNVFARVRLLTLAEIIESKITRIRNIQDSGVQKVEDTIASEFLSIANYAFIDSTAAVIHEKNRRYEAHSAYSKMCNHVRLDKNHDYGNAWLDMSVETITDLLYIRIQRIKRMLKEENPDLPSQYIDLFNWAILGYIRYELQQP